VDVFEAIRTVLAVREYDERAVPDAVVRKIVEAGWLTASSRNGQPWHFVVVQDEEMLQKLGKVVRTGPYIANAPMAVAVAFERSSAYGASDVSRAVQSMVLAAWEEGVGSNWAGFGGLDDAAKLLGVPDTYEVFAVLPFGYPKRRIGRGKKNRRPLADVVSRERFGRAFSS
jgi:nitroreductase